jgi:cytoskeletal protein CcmA (bactofilin family)
MSINNIRQFFFNGIRTNNLITQNSTINNLKSLKSNINTLNVNTLSISENINGNVNIDGNLDINGNVNIDGNLDINGNVNIDGNLDIYGNVNLYNDFTVYANIKLNSVDISGNLTIYNDLYVFGNSELNNLDVSGNLNINNDLTVYADTKLNSVDISGNLTIYNDMNVFGNTILGDNSGNLITIKGNTIFQNELPIYSGSGIATNSNQFVTLGDVQSTQFIKLQEPVDTASLVNINIPGVSTGTIIGGLSIQTGDRVVLTNQNNDLQSDENGIYKFDGTSLVNDTSGNLYRYGYYVDNSGSDFLGSLFVQYNENGETGVSAVSFIKMNLIYPSIGQGLQYVNGELQVSNILNFLTDVSVSNQLNVSNDVIIGGNLNVSGTTTSTIFTTSDYRIKSDIKVLDDSYNTDKLNPIKYTNLQNSQIEIGFLAHELKQEYPYLVTGEKDGEKLQTVNYIGLIGILVNEIKTLKARVEILEKSKTIS